ncbi:hypothetical protein TPHA_0E00210 [Tetrapisispora phaffii CBS 4417]|uniref:Uncharacterized protein n=1 Tax=Tetrapisispora phaffii (strain ATCC 24235 / CBS 4417 / NBRC 1672 / NRRL Y-8282 / UCD 70-5) TaxID=1071381 RepID=G8BT90_TETPH|nr:hypothetical protein TPHA_0E00210 [Tetrapisispora phaffii CBS 4417]CCE63118.1 hypothetical protein TPHA_0E00210 [Tetrapisispora phaffii CBS 4417]
MKRLKAKKEDQKKLDPNFTDIQIQRSPEKKKSNPNTTVNPIPLKRLVEDVNPNEAKVVSNANLPANTTSYFMQNFLKAKKEETKQVKEYQQKMSSRVHSFAGANLSKKYQSIIVEELEEYSRFNISKRYLPKEEVSKCLHNIKILRLNKLFAKIRPPKFSEPDYANWAVTGIICSKEDIKLTSSKTPVKFFKFTITNFQHTLDIFIFGAAGVEKYYNLRVGDIIFILNPEVLPWRPEFKGNSIKSFNLRISHKFDCILEIARSKDIAWCQQINRKTGAKCNTPINKSKQDVCDYHKEMQFRSANAKRVELSGTYALGAPTQIDSRPALYRSKNTSNLKPGNNFNIVADRRYMKKKENDPINSKRHHFSSSNSAKAFFDEDFQNPDMLVNLENKRRKIKDDKRDVMLQRALRESVGNSKLLLKDKSNQEIQSMRNTTDATLQNGFIQKLGFDPTGGQIKVVLEKSADKSTQSKLQKQKSNAMENLVTFKKSSVNLKPSREVLLEKLHHREQSFAQYKKSIIAAENRDRKSASTKNDTDSDDLEII